MKARGRLGRPAGVLGGFGVIWALVTVYLAVVLAAGQAPYDWAWSQGQHATPAQWRAHERYEQRGVGHHGEAAPTAIENETRGVAAAQGLWVEEGGHEAHAGMGDGYVMDGGSRVAVRAPALGRSLAIAPVGRWVGRVARPPTQPPRTTGAG